MTAFRTHVTISPFVNRQIAVDLREYCRTLPLGPGLWNRKLEPDKKQVQVVFLGDNNRLVTPLYDVFHQVNTKEFGFELSGQMWFRYSEYHPGDHYASHMDIGTDMKLTCSLQLSDGSEYDGGNLEILYGDVQPSVIASRAFGSATFYPTFVQHRVTRVTRGIRRCLVMWAGGPEFK
jgi:hypothetical protein